MRVLLVDGVVLIGLAVAAVTAWDAMMGLVAEHVPLPADVASGVLVVGWVVLAGPFLISLVRNTASLARLVSRSVVTSAEAAIRPAVPLLQGTYRVFIWLVVLLAVGIPLCAVLRPATGSTPAVVLVAGTLVAVAFSIWRGRGDVEQGFRSQAERVANLLARQAASDSHVGRENPSPIPGFDLVFAVAIPPDSPVVGKTLIELHLRALTGATVVAIHRSSQNVLLPTGREALLAGDVLGIAGTEEAIRKANDFFATV